MFFIERDIAWNEINMIPVFIYFFLSAIIAISLAYRSSTNHKIEVGFLCYFLLTGNINDWLTIVIPGFSFFEIQPDRFLFFMFLFLIFRRYVYGGIRMQMPKNIPWFMLAAILFLFSMAISQLSHYTHLSLSDIIVNIIYVVSFLVIIIGVTMVTDIQAINTIGSALIIGGILTSIVSIIQLGIDPMFMRYGDYRPAFGDVIRSNGIFSTEYFNAYYIIAAVAWSFHRIWDRWYGIPVLGLLSIGVICTFQRMSWLILLVVIAYYLLMVVRISWTSIFISGLLGVASLLFLGIVFQSEIQNSSLVRERLNEKVDSRFGYYAMVVDNIGKKPIFGYGDNNNEIYYENLLRITGSRDRASGETGDLHSGYFSSLWYYGFPSLALFILFVVSVTIYFLRLMDMDRFFTIIFTLCVIFLIGNLTNTLLFDKYLATLFAIHIGLGLGMRYLLDKQTDHLKNITD